MKTYMANPAKVEKKWYVVDAEGTAKLKPIEVLRSSGFNNVIKSGLNVGDKIIFEGVEKALFGGFMKHLQQNYAYRYDGGKVRSIISGV